MTCVLCGDKSKKRNKDFTRAVVEINNPEEIVLFHKVTIPASMGDDTTVQPAIGKYKNVLLVYEANNHAYLYSSDGVPTLLTSEVAQEMEEEIHIVSSGLSDEIENRKNADITLQNNIDASKISWTGDETTSSASGATALVTTTTGDFVWKKGNTVTVNFKYDTNRSNLNIDGTGAYAIDNVRSFRMGVDQGTAIQYVCAVIANQRGYRPIGRLRASSNVAGPVFLADNLTTTAALNALSANQGKVLNDKINSIANYSASETDTGATWIDGSKIYKKTIDTGTLPDTTVSTVTHGITGLNRIIKAEGCAYDTSLSLTIATGTISIGGNDAVIIASDTSVGWLTTKNLSNYTESYVTLYYTKN